MGKLLAHTDTRNEAISNQRRFAKQGIKSQIKKEYGGYAVYKTTGKPSKKMTKKKIRKKFPTYAQRLNNLFR